MIIRRQLGATIVLPVFVGLLGTTVLVALGWQVWRLMEEGRQQDAARHSQQLASARELFSGELKHSLDTWEELLSVAAQGASVTLPEDTVLLVIDSRGVVRRQGSPLPYVPYVSPAPEVDAAIFEAAEIQEIGQHDLPGAAGFYRTTADSSLERRVRAAALMRLARALRNSGKTDEALSVYTELAALDSTPVSGTPAALLAIQERASLFRLKGNNLASRRETTNLAAALWQGRFDIDHTTFDLYSQAIPDAPPTNNSFRLAKAVEELWPRWKEQPSGQDAWSTDGFATFTVWKNVPRGKAAIVGTIDSLVNSTSTRDLMHNLSVALALEDRRGRVLWGGVPSESQWAEASIEKDVGLPLVLRIANTGLSTEAVRSAERRNLAVGGLALMVLIISLGSYLVIRTVNRELKVARLQSDFVAAVSHEFRSPLTVMRNMTEMLEDGEVSPERLPRYYEGLSKETRRLHGLVESLLDFGRMESGRRTYRMEEADAAEIASHAVEEFRERPDRSGRRIELEAPQESLPVRVDREAVGLALSNLLDNAMKYSPESSTVRVSVERMNGFAGISVQDQGPGIGKREQREVFQKFSRGAAARTFNVKGTGIGLTIADYIVRAHGGRLELASEIEHGSRFTILLPVKGH